MTVAVPQCGKEPCDLLVSKLEDTLRNPLLGTRGPFACAARRAMVAEHKSPATIDLYERGVRSFLSWAEFKSAVPELNRATVTHFVADLLATGREPELPDEPEPEELEPGPELESSSLEEPLPP